MPSCGCPNTHTDNGSVQPCHCQPCSVGNLQCCSCKKEEGCTCGASSKPEGESAGKTCSCADCGCKSAAHASGSCCH